MTYHAYIIINNVIPRKNSSYLYQANFFKTFLFHLNKDDIVPQINKQENDNINKPNSLAISQ
ncbi:hypothetical protein CPARA_1gp163 (nucleomorph) [Cryptomonas paramecium]|uniref:Uncharacterized protein n=1 Tax=Cryptomonas paramaecium TaxID=2898 RepID=F2HHM5_9CRYP|nr:hypothetical protein CPARA_1gp163 [Cryptomonas paramecium]AEA38821.1 hypothetical protein CPARA_1gp163 [Cryptomonas paramecium]